MKSYIPYLSLRYLWFHKVSTSLGMLGVTLGVGLVIVVVGVMDGFQARLRHSLISNTTAVVVRPTYDVDAEKLVEALERIPGVKAASPVVYGLAFVAREGQSHRQAYPVKVIGIDAPRERRVADLESKLRYKGLPENEFRLIEGATPDEPFRTPEAQRAADRRVREAKQGVVLGEKLLERMGLIPGAGTRVRMFTVRTEDAKEPGRDPKARVESEYFLVTGALSPGNIEFSDGVVYMDRRDALSFYRDMLHQQADEVRLLLDDPARCDEVRDAINGQARALAAASLLPGGWMPETSEPLAAVTWEKIHDGLMAAVANERALLLVITSFSFIVVAFLIGSTQSMLVVEKTREIGVLRSLGASVAGTSAVFLGNGFFIGATGALAGWGVGVAITANIQEIADWLNRSFHLDLFPENIYLFKDIPIDVKPDFVLAVVGGAIAFALLGSLLPAVRAAALDPVESLHHE